MIDNGIGDLIRIADALPPAEWDAAARMMGFERSVATVDTTPDAPPVEPAPTPRDEERSPTRQREPASVPESALMPLIPIRVDTELATSVSWLQGTTAMSAPQQVASGVTSPLPSSLELEFEPLVPRHTASAVIFAVLATARDGAVDTGRAVGEIARRRPLRQLPRRQRPTLARGVVVLTDTGDGLAPFAPDVAAVHAMVSAVVGPARVKIGWFTNDPGLGVWLDDQLIPVEAMDPQTPVLILTDLGLIDTRTRSHVAGLPELQSIAARLGDRAHAVALVPVPSGQLTADRSVAVVPWERPTLGEVRQARRRARA